jgi:hypothetical protein
MDDFLGGTSGDGKWVEELLVEAFGSRPYQNSFTTCSGFKVGNLERIEGPTLVNLGESPARELK